MFHNKNGHRQHQKTKRNTDKYNRNTLFCCQHGTCILHNLISCHIFTFPFLTINYNLLRSNSTLNYLSHNAYITSDHHQKGYMRVNYSIKEKKHMPKVTISSITLVNIAHNSRCLIEGEQRCL